MGVRARFKIIDAAINLLLLTPLSVLFCFGVSGILDPLLLDYAPIRGCWILYAVATAVVTFVGYYQERIREAIPNSEDAISLVSYQPKILMCNFIIAFANVCHIRSLTDLPNYYLGVSVYSSLQLSVTALIVLWGLRCGRSIMNTPYCLGLDKDFNNYCKSQSLRDTNTDLSTASLIDQLLTHAIIHTAANLHWTGIWNLLDNFFLSLGPSLDVTLTWLAGCAIVLTFFYLQPQAEDISKAFKTQERALIRTLFENIWYFMANVASVMVWRSTWMVFEGIVKKFPIHHVGIDVTFFYASMVSFLMLAACHASSTLAAVGCAKDGDGGTSFSPYYLSEFMKGEIMKREANEMQQAAHEETTTGNGVAKKTEMVNDEEDKAKAD